MPIKTGIGGATDGVDAMRSWTVDYDEDAAKAIASNTQGTEIVLPGNTQWGGNYSAYGDTPPHMPGVVIEEFKGSQDGALGVHGNAKSEKITLVVDIASGGIIGFVTDFIGDGVLTIGASVASDASDAAPPTVIGTKLKLAVASGSMSFAELTDVGIGVITLVLERPVATYIDSSTGGTRKTTADIGNLTGSLTFTANYGDASDLPIIGEYYGAQIFVNATEFWAVKFLRCVKVGPFMANREANPPEILNATIEMAFSGFVTAGDASYLSGEIVDPNLDSYWTPT